MQPSRILKLLFAVTAYLYLIDPIAGFKWQLVDTINSDKVLTFSERYMFGNADAPKIMEQGEAYISITAQLFSYNKIVSAVSFAYAVFKADEGHQNDILENLCSSTSDASSYGPQWAHNIHLATVDGVSNGKLNIINREQRLNGTYFLYEARIDYKYPVTSSGWHNVAFKLCDDNEASSIARINGEVVFRNPYGYIPGELFGFLPFEGARMIAYVLFGMFYFYAYFRYKDSVLPLHHAIVIVYIFALTEATVWYAAYQDINLSGQPYCCPFPTTVVAALVLQVFRQTFARSLLLVVSLGYGIVRPKLLNSEWIAVSVVTVFYFVSALIGQVAYIVITNDVHLSSESKGVLIYQLPSFVIDVLVITWIYYALGSTIRILTEFQQTAKLRMYTQLAVVIAIFVTLFSVVAIIIMLDKSKVLNWPWQVAWLKDVLWEVLNFAILSTVCIICMPSENSRLLSYASQLPTDDPDEGDYGLDSYDDYSDDGDLEMTQHGKLGEFSSLPSADDEEYGLQDE